MTKRRISSSESEESGSEEMLSEEEEDDDNEVILKQEQQGISEYEKQRLARIAENRARMEALGLPKIASSLMGSSPNTSRTSSKIKGKRKVKNKGSKSKKKASVQKHLSSSDYIDDGDDELMKAIALSLKDSGEVLGAVPTDMQDATFTESKGNARSKRKKSFTSRMQMTEDEMVVHFFHFDEAGKGSISMRDLRRVAIAHDFMWTDKDLAEMIQCFDTDGDGKVSTFF
ncbi:caltractin ICL1b isoform X1 [Gossypium australe]|uniref:Caltractin ICL1b isoform X1 n=1 Tax=Gossypium australe TaxID=47621 RepID=A0A5B6W2C4_9ROSI|nr:caltractin ICL1b isoform X1 [Gossypium australe]